MTIHSGTNHVKFQSQGYLLAGLLFVPENFDSAKKYPTIVFTGPFNQIKEQTGAVYGRKLADKGYVVLSFDHLGYGDSEGSVRNNEKASWKMDGIRDAVSYLGTLPFVDSDKLYGLGVCAGGGYIAITATTDKRMKAIATVSGMMDNIGSYFGVMSKEQLMPLFKMANDARQKAYETGEIEYYDALGFESLSPEDASTNEGYDFYMTRRAGAETYPNYTHRTVKTLLEDAPLHSATVLAPYLYTPYLGIYGEKALTDAPANTAPLTINFHAKASEPKELFEVAGASHVSLYDIDKDVDKAVDKMVEFFSKY